MLVKDEAKYCWCFYDEIGDPQDSIENAINDYIDNYQGFDFGDNRYGIDVLNDEVEIGHPYYYVPEVDSEYVIECVRDRMPDEMYEQNEDYLFYVKSEHIKELSEELTKVFQAWEKRHSYENRVFMVQETETYKIADYI